MRHYYRTYGVLAAIALILVLVAPAASQPGVASPGAHSDLKGVITKIDSGMVFIKATGGLGPQAMSLNARNLLFPSSRAISSRKAERSGLRDTRVGDEVTVVFDEANLVTDLYKTGMPAPARRIMTGTLSYTDEFWKEIQLATPEGPESFAVDPLTGSKLPALGEGTPVILELDDANMVIDIHRTR